MCFLLLLLHQDPNQQKKDILDSLKREYSFDLNIHPEFMKEKRVKIKNLSNKKEEDIIFPKLNINQ